MTRLGIIPKPELCLCCSEDTSKQRYFIVKASGEKGPSYELVEHFFNVTFLSDENKGSFLCIGCYRLLEKIIAQWDKTDELCDRVYGKYQRFMETSREKRMVDWTPVASKRRKDSRSPLSEMQTKETGTSTHTSARRSLFPEENVMDATDAGTNLPLVHEDLEHMDKSTQTGVFKETRKLFVNKRQELIMYRSMDIKHKLSQTVHFLCNGSIKAAVKSLLRSDTTTVKSHSLTSVKEVFSNECQTFLKQPNVHAKTKVENIEHFSYTTMQEEFQKKCPLLWSLLSCIGCNKDGTYDAVKISTAMAILLHSRCVYTNAFQHVISVSLYNCHLQKEGFVLLSKLGITTSHVTLNRSLNKVKDKVTDEMSEMKLGLEQNKASDLITRQERTDATTEHDYAIKDINVDQDHEYCRNPSSPATVLNPGYRFNIDNLDFIIKVRNMTQDHQNQSKHYVQLMAIKDRVNCEHLPETAALQDLEQVPLQDFIPTSDDVCSLREDMIKVVSEIAIENLDAFHPFKHVLPEGFQHQFSKEMKQKSVVVKFMQAWNFGMKVDF